GSPRLKSKTLTPSALSCLALAPAASVADGCTAAAIFESASMVRLLPRCVGVPSPAGPVEVHAHFTEMQCGWGMRNRCHGTTPVCLGQALHVQPSLARVAGGPGDEAVGAEPPRAGGAERG